jgi:hypothetical protein
MSCVNSSQNNNQLKTALVDRHMPKAVLLRSARHDTRSKRDQLSMNQKSFSNLKEEVKDDPDKL